MRSPRGLQLFTCVGLAFVACTSFGGSDPPGGTTDVPVDASADGSDAGLFAPDVHATSCVPSPANLVAWWPADGNMIDTQKTSSGTAGGGAGMSYGQGEVGLAFDLGGSRFVSVADNATLQIMDAITVEAWIYTSQFGGRVVDKLNGFSGYALDTSSNKLRVVTAAGTAMSAQSLTPNKWMHVACTIGGGVLRVYVDGVLAGSASGTPSLASTQDLHIGADALGNTKFAGMIDEVAIYDRVLADGEIAQIAGAATFGRCKM